MTLTQLRTKHPRLIYQNYRLKHSGSDLILGWQFLLEPDITFKPQVIIKNVAAEQLTALTSNSHQQQTLENLVFNLGLMELPSYWKATCSPEIVIQAGALDQTQIKWWQDLFFHGLGEFFYTNQIDFTQPDFLKITVDKIKQSESLEERPAGRPLMGTSISNATSTNQAPVSTPGQTQTKVLVPVGGGKDSATVVGILDKYQIDHSCFLLAPHSPAAAKVIKLSLCQEQILAERTIDPELLKLNQQGYLNGHTPFSAYLAFASTLVTWLFGYQEILLGNERSANEENIQYHGQTVNHQYSKTFEFEQKFKHYLQNYLFPNQKNAPNYFSFLRPLYELQISQIFTQYPQYHPIFKSCNVGQQQEQWCHNCPKCLFVFIILLPFLGEKGLVPTVFQKNLLTKKELLPQIKQLLGQDETKPFECVGTHEETLIALYLGMKKYHQQNQPLPALLAEVQVQILSQEKNLDQRAQAILKAWDNEHHLPTQYKQVLKKELATTTAQNL